MEEIIKTAAQSPEYSKAIKLHQEIMANGSVAAQALYEMCRCLYQMKNGKLYIALGYENFDSYCEEMAHIKSRQAAKYVTVYEKLGKDFLQSTTTTDIEKLNYIAQINAFDRQELLEQVDLNKTSVRQLKEEIKNLKIRNGEMVDQMSLIQSENEELKKRPEGSAERIKELESRIKELENVNEQGESLKQDYEKLSELLAGETAKADELERKVKELESRPTEVAVQKPDQKEVEKQVRAAERKLEKEYRERAEKDRAEIERLTSENDSLKSAKDKLRERLEGASSADKALIEFEFYFKQMQEDLKGFVSVLERVEDVEKKEKFRAAAEKYLNMVLVTIGREDNAE